MNKCPNPREEHKHLRDALKSCGHPEWSFVKTATNSTKNTNNADSKNKNKHNNIVVPYMSGSSNKLRRISNNSSLVFKPSNALGQLPENLQAISQ